MATAAISDVIVPEPPMSALMNKSELLAPTRSVSRSSHSYAKEFIFSHIVNILQDKCDTLIGDIAKSCAQVPCCDRLLAVFYNVMSRFIQSLINIMPTLDEVDRYVIEIENLLKQIIHHDIATQLRVPSVEIFHEWNDFIRNAQATINQMVAPLNLLVSDARVFDETLQRCVVLLVVMEFYRKLATRAMEQPVGHIGSIDELQQYIVAEDWQSFLHDVFKAVKIRASYYNMALEK